MDRFPTVRAAEEYLIGRILAQADRDRVPLSDIERKMLYFSETGWTLPDMMAVNRKFDDKYDQDEYESKIAQIIQRIKDQPDMNTGDNNWGAAVNRLRDEDHYLLVLIEGASRSPAKRPPGDIVRAIVAATVILAVFMPIVFFVYSHVTDEALARMIVGIALVAVIVLVLFVASRPIRKSA